jgi:hypothetical protein
MSDDIKDPDSGEQNNDQINKDVTSNEILPQEASEEVKVSESSCDNVSPETNNADNPEIPVSQPEEQTKKCPFCAEDIKTEAIKCKYCNSILSEQTAGDDDKKIIKPPTKNINPFMIFLFGTGSIFTLIVLALLVLLSIVLIMGKQYSYDLFFKKVQPTPTQVAIQNTPQVTPTLIVAADKPTSIPTKKPVAINKKYFSISLYETCTINLSCYEPTNKISPDYKCIIETNRVEGGLLHYKWQECYPNGRQQSGDWVLLNMTSSRSYNSLWHKGEYKQSNDTAPWVSEVVFKELKDDGETILNVDVTYRGDNNLKAYLKDETTYTLSFNGTAKTVKALSVITDMNDKLVIMDNSENPLVLSANVTDGYEWHVTSIQSYNSSETYLEYLGTGNNYFHQGDYQAAGECFDKAINLAPNNNKTWGAKAHLLYETGNYKEALKCCNKALECREGATFTDDISSLKDKLEAIPFTE